MVDLYVRRSIGTAGEDVFSSRGVASGASSWPTICWCAHNCAVMGVRSICDVVIVKIIFREFTKDGKGVVKGEIV